MNHISDICPLSKSEDRLQSLHGTEDHVLNRVETIFTTETRRTENEPHAYTAEVFVEQLDIAVNHFQNKQFVVVWFHTAAEVQACVTNTRSPQ